MLHYKDYTEYIQNLSVKNLHVENKTDTKQISFTPYVYNTCSANCRFCSENLVRDGKVCVCDQVCADYREKLKQIFSWLKKRPVFLSISGREPSESVEQLRDIIEAANEFTGKGGNLTEKVMYSNLSGFCKYKEELIELIQSGKLTRIECSRHHYAEDLNQEIVNFKNGEKIKENAAFLETVRELCKYTDVKMVCVLQKKGVSGLEEVMQYLDFAKMSGVRAVVFRELAIFDNAIEDGKTAQYIMENRVELLDILKQLEPKLFTNLHITKGYYYYSFHYTYKDIQVDFEMSDYEEMIQHHENEEELYKLILYPNGMICKDWNMKGEIGLEGEFA